MTDRLADVTILHTERFVDGSSLAWDGEAGAGYLHVFPNPDAFASFNQVDLGDGCVIDIDGQGEVRGIETIGHEVGEADLLKVIRWVVRGEA
jgi:uncharacterized protein YuzE